MQNRIVKLVALIFCALVGMIAWDAIGQAQKSEVTFSPSIPKTWDDEALASLEVPLTDPSRSPVHVSSEFYYRIPVMKIYKSYPIYAPDKEPPGYLEWLKQQEPQEITPDFAKLKTEADWIKAGEIVFDAPTQAVAGAETMRDPLMWKETRPPVAADGTKVGSRYTISKRGEIRVGLAGCIFCHARVLPDGTVIRGAQGNVPNARVNTYGLRKRLATAQDQRSLLGEGLRMPNESMPWLKPDPQERLNQMTLEEIVAARAAVPPGVSLRQHTSTLYPPQISDLIGLKERRYFDHTGLVRHRTIADLMRYAALVQGMERFSRFGDFTLVGSLPDPATLQRYSDEMLYALALYLYSLKPPPNPNKFNTLAERGQKVFAREGCAACHTPPLYTNNKLTPVDGFTPPKEHFEQFSILPLSVGTDTNLALRSRKGTGYYKVPSLRGVWYRGPFEHNGSVATLEDWFDPRRLRDDYVPTGFRGAGVKTRAVKGHPFGLDLSVEDRQALIAFLKTL